MTEDEMQKDPNHGPHVEYDKEDPPITTFGQQLIHGTNIYLRSIGLV